MKAAEAAGLLTVAAAFDNRKPDEDAARAWAAAMGDLPFEDCRDAIVAHYRESHEWLMPGHVIARVRRLREKRLAEAGDLLPPDFSHLGDELAEEAATREWLAGARRAVANGVDPAKVNRPGVLRQRDMAKLLELMPRPDDE